MSIYVLIFVPVALYLTATLLATWHIRNTGEKPAPSNLIRMSLAVASLALIAHLFAVTKVSFVQGALNLGLASMLILMSAIIVLMFVLGGLIMPIRRLGILVYPTTILSLLFALAWGDTPTILDEQSTAFNAHILISIATYALLAIASIQALLYVYQERQIKKRTKPAMLIALPPLQTMEVLLFRLVGVGFALLTLTLLSGALFSQQIFGRAFDFNHHTVLAALGWLVFSILLYKRARHGLRGWQAMAWTMGGFALIQLGYFGTKIVSESLAVQ